MRTRDKIMSYIEDYYIKHGYVPSYDEICKTVGISSKSTLHGHMCRLMRDGLIKTDCEDLVLRPRAYRPSSCVVVKVVDE